MVVLWYWSVVVHTFVDNPCEILHFFLEHDNSWHKMLLGIDLVFFSQFLYFQTDFSYMYTARDNFLLDKNHLK